jgi:hypothetical protein
MTVERWNIEEAFLRIQKIDSGTSTRMFIEMTTPNQIIRTATTLSFMDKRVNTNEITEIYLSIS